MQAGNLRWTLSNTPVAELTFRTTQGVELRGAACVDQIEAAIAKYEAANSVEELEARLVTARAKNAQALKDGPWTVQTWSGSFANAQRAADRAVREGAGVVVIVPVTHIKIGNSGWTPVRGL